MGVGSGVVDVLDHAGRPAERAAASRIVRILKKIRQTQIDQVLNQHGRQACILLASDVHPAQDVAGHLTSRILDQDAGGNVLAGTNPPDKFPLVLGERVGPDGRNPPPTVQHRLGSTHVQGLSGAGLHRRGLRQHLRQWISRAEVAAQPKPDQVPGAPDRASDPRLPLRRLTIIACLTILLLVAPQ